MHAKARPRARGVAFLRRGTGNGDLRAERREGVGDGRADPRGTADDERRLAREEIPAKGRVAHDAALA